MATYNWTIGTAAQKAALLCDHTSLDFFRMNRAGTLADGSVVNGTWLPGTYTGQDCCIPIRNIDLNMTTTGGGVIFDCSPIAPKTSSTLFPYDTDYNASWSGKAPIIVWNGNLTGGPGFTVKNATSGSTYGNVAGIRKNYSSSVTGGESSGSISLDGWEFYGCDNGILATAPSPGGDYVNLQNCNFHDNGSGSGQTHNIYIDHFDLLAFINSTSINTKVGHNLKSLTPMNIVGWSDLRDTTVPSRAASYCIDMNGGIWLVYHSAIGQGTNDSNPSVMCNFQTDRYGVPPHEAFILGCTGYSADHFRGYFFVFTNRYLDPAFDYHTAPQLGWNDVTICFDGNDFQYVDQDLDYGSRGLYANIPVNSGITTIAGTNRLIATTNPAASTSYANVDSAKLAQSAVASVVTGLGVNDYDDTVIADLLALSITLQAGGTPPDPDDQPDAPPPDTPPDPPAIPDDPPVVSEETPNPRPRSLNSELQTLWVIAIAQQLKSKRQPVLTFSAAHTLTETESGSLFREVTNTLPTASPGLWYDLKGGSATRAGSDTIYDGASTGTALTAASSACSARLYSPKAGLWFVAKKTGTWSLA